MVIFKGVLLACKPSIWLLSPQGILFLWVAKSFCQYCCLLYKWLSNGTAYFDNMTFFCDQSKKLVEIKGIISEFISLVFYIWSSIPNIPNSLLQTSLHSSSHVLSLGYLNGPEGHIMVPGTNWGAPFLRPSFPTFILGQIFNALEWKTTIKDSPYAYIRPILTKLLIFL